MSNSSSPSESLKYGLGLGVLLVAGAAIQWFQTGFSAVTLVWLVPALALLTLWMRSQGQAERYISDVQAMTRDVSQGSFGRRITNIPESGRFTGSLMYLTVVDHAGK